MTHPGNTQGNPKRRPRLLAMTALLCAFVPSGCFNLNSGTGLDALDAASKLEAGAVRDAKKREEEAARLSAGGVGCSSGGSGGHAH